MKSQPNIKQLKSERREIFYNQRPRVKGETQEEYCNRMAITLLSLLKTDGYFLFDGLNYYYQDNALNSNYLLGDITSTTSPFHKHLIYHYNFSLSDTYAKQIYPRLFVEIEHIAHHTTLHDFSFYDSKKHKLYIRNNAEEMILVQAKGDMEIVPNGTDHIMMKSNSQFLDINFKEKHLVQAEFAPEQLDMILFDKINFDDQESYSAEHQRKILRKYVWSFFFKEIMPKKPILIVQGDTGSGKTSLMQNLGRMLWGGKFSVYGLPENDRDFINLLINNLFVVLDNVDEAKLPKYFLDTITSMTTAGAVSYRPLYRDPTAGNIKIMPECWIGISSRTPFFNRADVANRSVIMTLKKPEGMQYDAYGFEQEIINSFHNNWYYILGELQAVVQNLSKHRKNIALNYRMVEFANFAIRTCADQNEMDEMQSILENSVNAQVEFAAQDNPLIKAMCDLAEKSILWGSGKQYNMDELSEALYSGYGIQYRNAHSLGWAIRAIEETLKAYISIEKTTIDGRIHYKIGQKNGTQKTLF